MIPFFLLLQAAAPAPAPPPAPWEPRARTNANGSTSLVASAMARDGSSRMVLKCDRGTEPVVSVQFIAKQPLQIASDNGMYPVKSVSLRFDGSAAIESDWQFRGGAAWDADAGEVTQLTTMMAKAKTVKIETTNASGFAFEATVDLPPTEATVRQVLAACGYTLGQVPPPLSAVKK